MAVATCNYGSAVPTLFPTLVIQATLAYTGGQELALRPTANIGHELGLAATEVYALTGLPVAKGSTWVYAYVPYEPTTADPTQIVTATYRLTERMVDTEVAAPYFVAHVQRVQSLVEAQPGWSVQPISVVGNSGVLGWNR